MKKSLFLLSLVFLLGACSSDENTIIEPENTDPVEIMLSAKSLSIGVETKAPYEGSTSTLDETPLTARVISSKTSGNYSTIYSDGSITFNAAATATAYSTPLTSGTAYYPANGDSLYLIGVYPAGTAWGTPNATSIAATFTGKEDLMYAAQASGHKNLVTNANAPVLAFNHLLTLLNLSIIAEDAAAISAWGAITSITLSSTNLATVTPSTGGIAITGENATMPFYFRTGENADVAIGADDKTITLSESLDENIAYSIVGPVNANISTTDYLLTIKSANNTTGINVPIQLMDNNQPTPAPYALTTEGKSFDIKLTFKATQIVATATVEAWTESGGADIDIK
ncbi:fimbrillin family protein [Parabacteroides sp. OttesenSCG-928-G07]|nr:fimbrillin family protein [Parabacteroides sp. OttesenSCG-928-G21]MDL2277410.1 fimbrillin family protein [Parabacteroides sp. OttesenSCG-928-G07]